MSQDQLFCTDPNEYGNSYSDHLFEQYKLLVGSAEQNSQRRGAANMYLLAVNTFILSVQGVAGSSLEDKMAILIAVSGVLVSAIWFSLIHHYKTINRTKFKVIHRLEKKLPAAIFAEEWRKMKSRKGRDFRGLSLVESFVPVLFGLIYIVIAFGRLYG